MSLYAAYVLEREGFQTLEGEHGFCTYKVLDDSTIYLRDIYVVPSMRATGEGKKMLEEVERVARDKNCTAVIGSVDISLPSGTLSTSVLLKVGFSITHASGSLLVFRKEIK